MGTDFMGFEDEKQIRERLSNIKREMSERAKRMNEVRAMKNEKQEEKEHRLRYADVIAYEFAMFDATEILNDAFSKGLITKKACDLIIKRLINTEGKSLQKLRKRLEYGKWW